MIHLEASLELVLALYVLPLKCYSFLLRHLPLTIRNACNTNFFADFLTATVLRVTTYFTAKVLTL